MKRVMCSICAGLIAMWLVYLAGAFANADFNIAKWEDWARGMVAFAMLVAGAGSGIGVYGELED